jgi:NAD(P)-dependent dehydrogenase (short-subunit alcohol dehydrogenase family)
MPQLDGKVAIVTGGSRGIGYAIARRLAQHGARVAVTGRDLARLRTAVAEIGPANQVMALPGDVSDPAVVAEGLAKVEASFGGLDILVNNAGIGVFRPVEQMSDAKWQSLIATNLTGPFNWCRAVIPVLRRRKGGTIVNISSLASRIPFAGAAAYAATKAALNAFSEALLEELRYDDIRVALVLPGSVNTTFNDRAPGTGADWRVAPEDVAQVVLDLLLQHPRALTSRIEIRPSKPSKEKSST